MNNYSLDTLCVQAGYEPKNGEARITPIVQSTTFKYDSADEVAGLFDLKNAGFFYSRIGNPTVETLEKKIAALEGGSNAVATSSGQAATFDSIMNISKTGDHIVAMNNLYGGTVTLLGATLKQFGITTTFLPLDSTEEEIQNAIKPNTRLIFGETIGNPGVEVCDIEKLANVAHKNDLPLFIDNTFATPVLCRPLDFGADIVIHSTTKYLDGHATSMGGIVVDGGKFNWNNGKFPSLSEPEENYHGLIFTEAFKDKAFGARMRTVYLRDLGAGQSPFNAFLTNLGTETLHLRMERHSSNALEVAKFLESHEKVEWVNYPFLESSKSYEKAKKYLKGGSGVIAFGVKGGYEEAKRFIDSIKLASLVVHVGDLRTHILHPASMTHRQLKKEELESAGITENMVRFSVGIEDVKDIIDDLSLALR